MKGKSLILINLNIFKTSIVKHIIMNKWKYISVTVRPKHCMLLEPLHYSSSIQSFIQYQVITSHLQILILNQQLGRVGKKDIRSRNYKPCLILKKLVTPTFFIVYIKIYYKIYIQITMIIFSAGLLWWYYYEKDQKRRATFEHLFAESILGKFLVNMIQL